MPPIGANDLYPGAVKEAFVTVTNPNPYPIEVTGINAGGSRLIGAEATACAAGTVRTDAVAPVEPGTALTRSDAASTLVAASGSGTYKLVVRMSNSATDTCKNQSFVIGDQTTPANAYSGTRTIAFSGPAASPNSTQPKYPTAGVTFTNGVGTAAVTLYRSETVALHATEPSRSGSTPVTVDPAAATALAFTTSTPSCSSGSVVLPTGGSTWTSKVSRTDAYGNTPASSGSQLAVTVTNADTSSLTILAGANETSGGFAVQRPNSNNGLVVTASASGYTPASCTVYKI